MTTRFRLKQTACALCIMVTTIGCAPTLRVEQAQQGEQVDIDTFLHEHLQRQPMITVSEAYRAMVLLAEGEDAYDTFEARRDYAEQKGLVKPEWGLQREACIDRGSLAYMLCRILRIRGGVDYALLGRLGIGDRRYALRELVYRRMMPDSPAYMFITGGELVELLAKADTYMAHRGMYEQDNTDIAEILDSDQIRIERPEPGSPSR